MEVASTFLFIAVREHADSGFVTTTVAVAGSLVFISPARLPTINQKSATEHTLTQTGVVVLLKAMRRGHENEHDGADKGTENREGVGTRVGRKSMKWNRNKESRDREKKSNKNREHKMKRIRSDDTTHDHNQKLRITGMND